MFQIINLCKTKDNIQINHMDISLNEGIISTIVSNNDVNQMIIGLILGLETPAKGEILFHGTVFSPQKHNHQVGWILNNTGFYERMSVVKYLAFFQKCLNSKKSIEQVIIDVGLQDVAKSRIEHLSSSQRKRLNFAKESLKDLKLLIIQEPLNELNHLDSNYITQYLNKLLREGVAILCLCHSFKDALMLGGNIYVFNESGYLELDVEIGKFDDTLSCHEVKPQSFKIDKIPSKVDDRILLFNPIEIDYIESEQGVSYLHVRGERYACTFTLKELEGRLRHLGFFMCHRSYLVNLQKIREIITWSRNSFSLTIDDKKNSTIPLSKNRIDELKSLLSL